jgi:hypothetical protein
LYFLIYYIEEFYTLNYYENGDCSQAPIVSKDLYLQRCSRNEAGQYIGMKCGGIVGEDSAFAPEL